MAQVIETYCDGCLGRGEQVRAKTYRVSIGVVGIKHPTHDIDLCDDCAKPLAVVVEGVQESGRLVGKSGRPKAPRLLSSASTSPASRGSVNSGSVNPDNACPLCDHVATTPTALSAHTGSIHHMTLPEARGEAVPYKCDVCGRRLATPQGAGAHRKRSHPDAPSLESVELLRVEP